MRAHDSLRTACGMHGITARLFLMLLLLAAVVPAAAGASLWVKTTGSDTTGDGSMGAPYRTVQYALNLAITGDTVVVGAGTYTAADYFDGFEFKASGTSSAPIVLMAAVPRTATLQNYSASAYRAMQIDRDCVVVDGFKMTTTFTGYNDIVRVQDANHVVIRNCEIYNSRYDGIDIETGTDITIQNCTIHHLLAGSFSSQSDAHGVVAGNSSGIVIEDCAIYYCSGDCFQIDPDRDAWDNVVIRRCDLWTGPLPAAAAGFSAGQTPGENALDTKNGSAFPRARVTVSDSRIHGFRNTPILDPAGFNIKENVHVTIDRCRVYDNEWAARLRGPATYPNSESAWRNNIVYRNTSGALRFEDDVENLELYHNTFWSNGNHTFYSSPASGTFTCRNNLFDALPADAKREDGNTVAAAADLANVGANDYHAKSTAPFLDTVSLAGAVTADFERLGRPTDAGYDPGAYEYHAAAPSVTVTAAASCTRVAVGEPLVLTVTTAGMFGVYTCAWSFGDGNTGSGIKCGYVYTAAGTYTALVTVTGENYSATSTVEVIVGGPAPQPPVAVVGVNPVEIGADPHLNGEGSYDPNGTITAYAWDLNWNVTAFDVDATGAAPAVAYGTAGTRTVALRVTDNDGLTGITTLTVTVRAPNQMPRAAAAAAHNPLVADTDPGLNGTASTDPDGSNEDAIDKKSFRRYHSGCRASEGWASGSGFWGGDFC
ncbi:MAG: right-handed parallel beta-helix repeat-containing protein [Planctomycetota bacterium]